MNHSKPERPRGFPTRIGSSRVAARVPPCSSPAHTPSSSRSAIAQSRHSHRTRQRARTARAASAGTHTFERVLGRDRGRCSSFDQTDPPVASVLLADDEKHDTDPHPVDDCRRSPGCAARWRSQRVRPPAIRNTPSARPTWCATSSRTPPTSCGTVHSPCCAHPDGLQASGDDSPGWRRRR